MTIRIITIFFLLIFATAYVSSQSTTVLGSIKSVDGEVLAGASIVINKDQGTISDENGRYQLAVSGDGDDISLQFRMLGYTTVDTLIGELKESLVLDIVMEPTSYEQPEVVIQADRFEAFKQESWRILDIELYHGKLLILYLKGRSRILEMFTTDGISMERVEIDKSCNSIFVSCMGGLHLIGEEQCIEFDLTEGQLMPRKEYARLMYDKSMAPCLQSKDDFVVLRYWSQHNKKAKYVKYQDEKLTVLQEIFDELSATTAQSYYREIISSYHYHTSNPEEGAIDAGTITRDNIIREGSWSGDLSELAINNGLHNMISYYQNVEARPLNLREVVWQDEVYVFDLVNKKVLLLGVESGSTITYNTPDFVWEDAFELIVDDAADQLYLFADKQKLYKVTFSRRDCILSHVPLSDLDNHKALGANIYDNCLYYYTSDIIEGMKSRIHRVMLRE